eukprot:360018-Chlamydomonas_euryale.AAC.7
MQRSKKTGATAAAVIDTPAARAYAQRQREEAAGTGLVTTIDFDKKYAFALSIGSRYASRNACTHACISHAPACSHSSVHVHVSRAADVTNAVAITAAVLRETTVCGSTVLCRTPACNVSAVGSLPTALPMLLIDSSVCSHAAQPALPTAPHVPCSADAYQRVKDWQETGKKKF